MMMEVVAADGRLTPSEIGWLDAFIPSGPGSAIALFSQPSLTDAELALIRPEDRMGAMLQAWNVALIDDELAPGEEQLLARFATGLKLSQAQADQAARNRRVILPLERLGIDVAKNPALYRFLELCSTIPGISKIDHCTFVTRFEHTEMFLDYWASQGFTPHGEWNTTRYPARHIALVRGRPAGFPWEEMVGLTVSDHPDSPIHRTMPPLPEPFDQTHQLQHIAINVTHSADMHVIKTALEKQGIRFMTPVLSYDDGSGAGLRQMFTATDGNFFVEFAQRIPNPAGEPFSGFNVDIIDDLYKALDWAESSWASLDPVMQDRHLHWLPSQVQFLDRVM
jgi:hypothetical protein